MAVVLTEEEIVNLALDRLGQRSITSITTPTTEIETICKRHYNTVRPELLRRYIFNFAKKYDILEKSTDVTPPYGFANAFYIPTDCLRILSIGDVTTGQHFTSEMYDLVENHIVTSYDSAGDLRMQYIKDAKLVTEFDPLFVRLLVLHLAANMAYKFTLKNSLIAAIRDDAADVALAAAAISGQERPPVRVQKSKMRLVRYRGTTGGSKYISY